jgi:hypothetical protein
MFRVCGIIHLLTSLMRHENKIRCLGRNAGGRRGWHHRIARAQSNDSKFAAGQETLRVGRAVNTSNFSPIDEVENLIPIVVLMPVCLDQGDHLALQRTAGGLGFSACRSFDGARIPA